MFFKEHPDAGLEHQIQVGVASGCGQAVRYYFSRDSGEIQVGVVIQ